MDLSNIVLAGVFDVKEKQDLRVVKWLQTTQSATLHLLQINTESHFVSQREAIKNMRAFVQANELEDVEFHLWADESVEKGIRNFCLDNQVDFLAMGTHGRRGLMHVFKGSLTEDIVNHIFQPVLSFHLGS
jgi:nucleotide-binding universal stress UspA family protein